MVKRLNFFQNIRGFTLLEVIIAFAIMALILGATFSTFSTGLRQVSLSGQYTGAVVRAESKLALIGQAERLVAGVNTGRLDRIYTWRTEIFPVPREDPDSPDAPEEGPVRLYHVIVSVFWGEGREKRDVTLKSQRLGVIETP